MSLRRQTERIAILGVVSALRAAGPMPDAAELAACVWRCCGVGVTTDEVREAMALEGAFAEEQHPRDDAGKFTSSGRAIGEVVKETDKGVLLKHGSKEGWLQKQWTRQEDGQTTFDQKHLDKFQESHITLTKPEVLRETDKALLIKHGDAEGWLPKSQVERLPDGGMKVPRWCADKLQATHDWVELDHVSETASGKAYKCVVDVSRADGEPESATVFIPKSQVKEHNLDEWRASSPLEMAAKLKIPVWLKAEKEAEYEAMHSGGGFTFHLMW